MKLKHYFIYAVLMAMTWTACSDDNDIKGNNDEEQGTTENVSGEVEGIWEAHSTINVTGHLTVPAGKSLTIEEGVQVIFSTDGVGANHAPIEFTVDGNLYCKGTITNPIRFSIAEELRTHNNIFNEDAMWGGIVATANCAEMLIDIPSSNIPVGK